MLPQRKPYLSPEAYLAQERQAATRSDYWEGEIYALAGASEAHNLIVANLVISLGTQLKGRPCRVYSNDMRVKAQTYDLYTYPDVVLVCDQPQFEDHQRDTLINPTVLIEVLSPSTELYDRGTKFTVYRTLASLTDYLMVSQHHAFIEQYTRQPDGRWVLTVSAGLDAIVRIESAGCELRLADVYDKVEFLPAPEASVVYLRRIKEEGAEYELRLKRHQTGHWDDAERADEG